MTKQEYAAYQERVASYLKGCEAVSTGPCPGCKECQADHPGKTEDDDWEEEPWFSRHPCEICGTHLGGDRVSWHAVIDGEIIHGTCCTDCNYFLCYGRLDDQTMLEIEGEKP